MTENKVTGKKYRILTDAVNDIWDRISFWTKASDIEYNDGTDGEALKTQVGTIEGELTANGNRIYMDYKNGKYGYNTSASRGASTFHPFRPPHTTIYTMSIPRVDMGEDHTHRFVDGVTLYNNAFVDGWNKDTSKYGMRFIHHVHSTIDKSQKVEDTNSTTTGNYGAEHNSTPGGCYQNYYKESGGTIHREGEVSGSDNPNWYWVNRYYCDKCGQQVGQWGQTMGNPIDGWGTDQDGIIHDGCPAAAEYYVCTCGYQTGQIIGVRMSNLPTPAGWPT